MWRASLPPALLLLLLLANSGCSHSPAGVLLVFAGSLFCSLGFLLFGRQRFTAPAQEFPRETRDLA
ncbi:hypothetical protein A9179_13550 [Pseudomonas alcaligenes]|uniref:Uncharacterized protein n=2 Tax=Aquipseudomonas alcaligenes TaxID=43263 RepID=A0ABR7S2V4_AQUAC|nr:hypothetical protein [Pseudomonas alcaligenes]